MCEYCQEDLETQFVPFAQEHWCAQCVASNLEQQTENVDTYQRLVFFLKDLGEPAAWAEDLRKIAQDRAVILRDLFGTRA